MPLKKDENVDSDPGVARDDADAIRQRLRTHVA